MKLFSFEVLTSRMPAERVHPALADGLVMLQDNEKRKRLEKYERLWDQMVV